MSDTEDRVRAFLVSLDNFSSRVDPEWFGPGAVLERFANDQPLLLADVRELASRPSLAELRDVAMTHQRLRYVKGAWLCACGHKLMADGLPVTDQLAAHQLAMMEAAT